MSPRYVVALTALLCFSAMPIAQARSADDDTTKADSATAAPAKSAGTIEGVVSAVDYRSNSMTVTAGSRKVDVTVLPSTNIQGPNNSFRTIADIQKGSRVRVLLSQRAGTFTAQIITLR